MTRRDADDLAAELNERSPVNVTYEVRETENPKGDHGGFYVTRMVDRSVRDEDAEAAPKQEAATVAAGYSKPGASAAGDDAQLTLAVA